MNPVEEGFIGTELQAQISHGQVTGYLPWGMAALGQLPLATSIQQAVSPVDRNESDGRSKGLVKSPRELKGSFSPLKLYPCKSSSTAVSFSAKIDPSCVGSGNSSTT